MTRPHLVSALITCLLVAAALVGGEMYATSLEARDIHALASDVPPIGTTGVVLSRQAARQPDLLLIYGSSEMQSEPGPYNATRFFAAYPTGFAPFIHAEYGFTMLTIAQDLAALGSDLRGKRVVISMTSGPFYESMVSPDAYAGRWSRAAAYDLVSSSALSEVLKQRIALRMLDYPQTLQNDPLLAFTLHRLAENGIASKLALLAVWPLDWLQARTIELQEHLQILLYINAHRQLRTAVRRPATIDWQDWQQRALAEQQMQANNNPYGFENRLWTSTWRDQVKPGAPGSRDKRTLKEMQASAEWQDLDILLKTLQGLGAQPLLLCEPFNGAYWDVVGLSPGARSAFYRRLRQVAAQYHVPLVDFQEHEADKYFSIDPSSHPSRVGWVYINQVLDDFYHGRITGGDQE